MKRLQSQQLYTQLSSMHPGMRFVLERPFTSAAIAIVGGFLLISTAPVLPQVGAALSTFGKVVGTVSFIGLILSVLRRNKTPQRNVPPLKLFGKFLIGGLLISLVGVFITFFAPVLNVAGIMLLSGGAITALARAGQNAYLHYQIRSPSAQKNEQTVRPSSGDSHQNLELNATPTLRKGRVINVIRRSPVSSQNNLKKHHNK